MGDWANVQHYRWPVNLGMGVLLAGGWSLPASALEVLPAPVDGDLAQLLSKASSEEREAIASSLSSVSVLPEQLPPSRTALEEAVASFVVTPAVAPVTSVTTAIELPQTAITAPVASAQASPIPRLSATVTVVAGDRFKPEFTSTLPPEISGDELAQSPVDGTDFVESVTGGQQGRGLSAQAEADIAPVVEDANLLEAAETLLNNGEVPAGDLLESVDGLEDSGIAGERALEEESSPSPSTNSDDAGVVDTRDGGQQSQPREAEAEDAFSIEEAEAEGFEAEGVEAGDFGTEDFDTEDFEAEDFEFEEDEANNLPNPPGSTVGGEEFEGDPELGILRLRKRPLAEQKKPFKIPVFLIGNVGYISNGNTLAGIDPVNDRLFRSGLSLIASPRLSKRTALIASVQGNLYRYDELSRLDYNEVRLQASLRHVLTRKVYGDLGWTHRQLFLQEDGDRFLGEHAAFASLTRRDPLTKKTSLTSFYNLRVGFADPETSSRLRNTVGMSLRHRVTPALQASLTGRMTLTNFTQQSRQDFYTQGLAQLSYKISKAVNLSLFGSLTRGNSSNQQVNFDNSTLGVSLSGNVKLF